VYKNTTHKNKVLQNATQKLATHHFLKNGIVNYSIFDAIGVNK
jgi:hypothetical protein